jgi:hypothetical protein
MGPYGLTRGSRRQPRARRTPGASAVAEPPQALDQDGDRHALDRIKIDR